MCAEYENSKETRQRLFEQTKAELIAKQVANSTSYDTAVLTLSSAFLALSVAFIKDVVAPLSTASLLSFLYLSWSSYSLAIISTIASFLVGQAGYRNLIAAAERYYIKGDREAHNVSVQVANRIEKLNILNGAFFTLGTVLLLVFVISNFTRIAAMPTAPTSSPAPEQRGQPTTPFQQVPTTPTSPAPAAPPSPPVERRSGA